MEYKKIECICGKDARIVNSGVGTYIHCPYCGKETHMCSTEQDAIEIFETYGHKMRRLGWKNAHTEHPDHEGLFLVTTREGKKLKRKFEINKFEVPVWKDGNNDICWWKEIENE